MDTSKGEDPPPPTPKLTGTIKKNYETKPMDVDNYSEKKETDKSDSVIKTNQRPIYYYRKEDVGPFVVIIEAKRSEITNDLAYQSNIPRNNNIGKYNHLKIARDLFNLKLSDIMSISTKGKNKLGIKFTGADAANNFVNNEIIKNKGYHTYIPFNMVTSKGVIRGIDPEIKEAEIKNMITCNVEIVEIKRLSRREIITNDKGEIERKYNPTGTVLLTFRGTNMPRMVELCRLPFMVSPYIPPVTQCFNCLLYGHTRIQCRGTKKCNNCTENHSQEEDYKNCTIIRCHYCKNNSHKSTNKTCPEYGRQLQIKKIMAYDNLTYYDAAQLCPKMNANTEFERHPNDFPRLTQKPNNPDNDIIKINQRRQIAQETSIKAKRPYANVASNTPPKLTKTQSHDKQKSTEPQRREKTHNIPIYASPAYKHNTKNTTEPESALENLNKIVNLSKQRTSSYSLEKPQTEQSSNNNQKTHKDLLSNTNTFNLLTQAEPPANKHTNTQAKTTAQIHTNPDTTY